MMSSTLPYVTILLWAACFFSFAKGECIEDGTRYKNATLWKRDACNICSCNNNIIICHQVNCEDPICDETKGESLFIPPNSCCPECTTERGRQCKKDGQIVAHNTEWSGANCTSCRCNDGTIVCDPVTCDLDLQCGYGESPWLRPGDCCKKCVSNGATCTYDGEIYRDGDVWSPSPCERAKCSDGEIIYQVAQCSPVICPPGEKSVLRPDQCCPQCVGASCTVEATVYESGERFQLDSCRHCACVKGEVTCHTTNCDVTDEVDGLRCKPGTTKVTREGNCCPECVPSQDPCDFEGVRHYHGDLWNASNCQACVCTRGRVQCFPLQCSAVKCGRNEKLQHNPGSCCPECVAMALQCHHNDLSYRHGDEWQTSACERCACIHGVTQCYEADCAPCPENTVPVQMPGECCPTCELVTCHADCATCHGPGYGQCTTCKNARHLLQEGKCVRRCLSGFFHEGKTCKRCHSSCESCELADSPSTCTSCTPPLQLQDGSCVENCIPGYYDYDGLCKPCLNGCKRCLSASVCVECTNRTMLVQEGQCVESCGNKFFFDDDMCKPCHTSCTSCSIAHGICDSCPSHKMMQNGLCVSECSRNFYQTNQGACEACHDSCASCSGPSSDQCISCVEGRNLLGEKCVELCSVGHYAEEGECQECHSSCRSCGGSSASDCNLCSAANQVIQPSADLSPTGKCVFQCDAGYFSEGKYCQSCHDSCSSCDGPTNTNCTSCDDGRFMLMTSQLKRMCLSEEECAALSLSVDIETQQCINKEELAQCNKMKRSLVVTLRIIDDLDVEKCVKVCHKGTFKKETLIGSMCLPCASGCASCKSESNCVDCADDKVLSTLTSQCVDSCEEGYYHQRTGRCEPCPASCVTCEIPSNGGPPRCTACKDPEAVLQFGECVSGCAEQFYADVEGGKLGTPVCRECDWTCNRCDGAGPDQCLECMPGSKLQSGRCVKLCDDGYYDSSSICLPCKNSHCLSCNDADTCKQCKLPFHLHENQCVPSCPRRHVADPATNECVSCPAHCLRCSAPSSCDQCDGQTFMLPNTDPLNEKRHSRKSVVCVKKCKKGFFGNELTRQCQKNTEKPIITIVHPIMITMGGRSPIDDTIMQITDEDSTKEQLSVVLELEPGNGRIVVDNVPIRLGERIPVTKLSQGRVWFVHDGSLWRPGVAAFRATDGHMVSERSNLDVLIISRSPPTIVKNKILIVSSGETKQISSVLNITDSDNPQDVAITLLSAPKYGHVTGGEFDMAKYTLNDLRTGNIAYVCNRKLRFKTNLDDVIDFQVTDGYYVINVAVRIQIVLKLAAAPALVTNQGARVRSGGLLHITPSLLRTAAEHVKDKSKLVYILKPVKFTSGEVVRITPMSSDDPMIVSGNWVKMEENIYRSPPLMTFSQEDIDEGDVWYRDLGGNGEVEAFDFEVVDQRYRPPRHVTDDIFRVSVIPENTEKPQVARGLTFPPQMTATEDRVTVLHSGYMRYTDEDTPDRDLIYNITRSIPSYFGSIEHVDIPNVPITVFTQSEVDSNKIIFRPPASEFSSFEITDEVIMDDEYDDVDMMDEEFDEFEEFGYPYRFEALTESTRDMPKALEFDYTVSDGQHTLEPATFTIKIINQGNTEGPRFTNPHPRIDVTQGGTAPIGETQLSVTDSDTHERDLIYTLVKRPRHGSVIRNDHGMRIILREGDSFTHDEIQMNSLQYVHDGTSDSLDDQVQISVTDTTHTATKVIQILVLQTDSTGPSPDIATELSLVVDEGSIATLGRENLAYVDQDSTDKEILYHVKSELHHGILDSEVLGDIRPGDTFTQEDINIGHIKYRSQDDIGLSPLTDELRFSVTDRAGNKLANQMLTITITPGGNEPPVVTVGTGIVVEEGSSVLITPLDVIATDLDTPKHELTITITRKPVYGYFLNTLRSDVMNADEDEVWFSMQDVLDGAIYYVQSLHRHSEPTTDFFKFQVSDGHNISPTYSMNVTIQPTNDEAPEIQTRTLVCKNGQATMVLNASLIVSDEDSAYEDLMFTVTSLPRHGSLVRFSQKMPHDAMNKWKMMGNGSLQLDMMEKKKLMKLRVGSTFTYQDIVDELICFESEGYTSPSATLHRRRRDTLGFILSDGNHETPGSINIDVEPADPISRELDEFDEDEETDIEMFDGEIEEEVMYKTLGIPEIEANTGITVEKGSTTVIRPSNLRASDSGSLDNNSPRYVVVREPAVGYLQLAKNQFIVNISSSGESVFLQQDIDEGIIRYIHPKDQPGGSYNFRFNVVGASGSTLPEQTFNIDVKDDRRPPVIRINDGIAVQESSSQVITSEKLSATDEAPPNQLVFTVTKLPALGQIEFVPRPGHMIRSFTQDDVNKGRVQYVHTSEKEDQLSDQFTFSLSDGANKILQSFFITVIPVDNHLPVLDNKGIRVQEGVRKTITEFELRAVDKDTSDNLVTFSILQSPLHGNIERTNHGGVFIPVTGFSMDDIYQGRISYHHDGSNTIEDRFTFTVEDGTNKGFTIVEEGTETTTSSHQFFQISILPVDDGTPRLVTNLGLHHLDYNDNKAMARIMKRNLLTEDPDTSAKMITYTITSEPRHGHLESNLNPGQPIKSFSQEDVNMGIIRYVLRDTSIDETRDSFMFNVRDSMPNVVTGNIFHIRWSVFTFAETSYTVKEGAGEINVLIRRQGNLNYAIVMCSTEPGTATSIASDEPGQLDYVEYAGQVQFDENAEEKVCTIEINDDTVYEGEESFTVRLSQSNYALLGAITETVVTIDDTEDKPTIQFDEAEYVVQENDDAVFLPLRRTGDIDKTVSVICYTQSVTATGSQASGRLLSGSDYKTRQRSDGQSQVIFAPGVNTATCDVKLIDDSIYEEDEKFIVKLGDPSTGSQVGEKSEATVTISGPNDAASVFFSDHHYEFTESQGTVDVTVVRTGSDLSQSTDVWCSTRARDPVSAVPGEDFVQSSNKVTFRNGETTKICTMTLLDDSQSPSVEGKETFEVYLSSVLRAKLVTPNKAIVTINDTLDDVPTMEFLQASVEVKEKDKVVSLPINREGDVSGTSSVICYTRQATASVEDDFNERSNTETSRIVFKPGQKLAYCNVTIVDDSQYESSERFSVHLTSAIGNKWYGATVGENKVVEITITNDEDAPTIMFERAEFSIREPDLGEDSREFVVKVIRTGDATEVSKVRCSTRDGSATSGSDYEPKSRMLRFHPGDTEVLFTVNILPNSDTEWHETFLLVLGPDDPVNAVLGPISQATVTVLDKDAAGSLVLPTTPVVVSLLNYDEVKNGLDLDPSPGYPLVCVTPCDPRYPEYADTRNLCEEAGINSSAIAFSWEVAMPTNFQKGGGSQPFERVRDTTPFTSVDTKVLDSIYFSRRFHVRCVAQAVDSTTGTGGTPLRSNVVTIGTDSGLCHNPIVSGTERGFQAQSFISKLDYIPADAEEHPNSLEISIEIPHQDGRLPLISTMPFNNLKLLLSRSIDRQQHLCSNMMYSGKTIHIKPEDLVLDEKDAEAELGKYLGFIEPTDYSKLSLGPGFDKPFQLDPTVRERKTIDLYKYLNLKSCVWKFKAYYEMNQLIDYCNGRVDNDYEIRDESKSLVTVTVPLHVSYVYVTAPTGWGSLEHRTEMQFSFVYKNVLWTPGIQTEGVLAADILVKNMKLRDDGKLEIKFETKVKFRGLFVLEHHTLPNRKSLVLAPEGLGIKFDLENIWTENTYDSTHQQWRAVSKYSKKDYSGEYEIQLLPCTVTATAKWHPTKIGQEPSCTAYSPQKFKVPITYQQTNRPVAVEYTLNTDFHLCNNEKLFMMDPRNAKDGEQLDYRGSFSKGQTIFGRVFWSPKQDLHSAYKLKLEKVYLCTGRDGYVPTYDPAGVTLEGPQYGCIQPSRKLQYRFLLLDRSNRDSEDKYFHDVPFEAYFAGDRNEYSKMSDMPGVDGFLIKVDALYKVDAGHQWYLQVLYGIAPDNMRAKRSIHSVIYSLDKRNRRSLRDSSTDTGLRNGTNMHPIFVAEDSSIGIIAGASVAAIIPMILCCCFAFCLVRRRRRLRRKEGKVDKNIDFVKKCAYDDDVASDDSWPLSGEKEHKRSNSSNSTGLATVVALGGRSGGRQEKNYNKRRDVSANDVELQPLNACERQNSQVAIRSGKSSNRKKIPIVNNLRRNNDDGDDGTEV